MPLLSMDTTNESIMGESLMAPGSHASTQSLHREHSSIFVVFALPPSTDRRFLGQTSDALSASVAGISHHYAGLILVAAQRASLPLGVLFAYMLGGIALNDQLLALA